MLIFVSCPVVVLVFSTIALHSQRLEKQVLQAIVIRIVAYLFVLQNSH